MKAVALILRCTNNDLVTVQIEVAPQRSIPHALRCPNWHSFLERVSRDHVYDQPQSSQPSSITPKHPVLVDAKCAIPHGRVMVSQNFSFDFTFQHSGINKVRDNLVPLLLRLHLYGCCCPWTDEFLVWNPQIGRALYIGLDSLTHHVHKRDACRFLSTRSSGKDGCQRQRERFAFGPVYMSPSSSAAFSHVSATTAPSQSSSSHFLLSFSKRATACCWAGDPCRG